MGNAPFIDSMVNDGLWCAFENYHMGNAGEAVAEQTASAATSRTPLPSVQSSEGR